jgi:aspartyl-tRNA synthetase
MNLYREMTKYELDRQKKDLLYHVFVNTEASTLNDICEKIQKHVLEKYGSDKLSLRLNQMLLKTSQNEDRTAKHALLLFALVTESEDCTNAIFLTDTPRVPPKKFVYFVEKDLPQLLEKLLTGAFTSVRAFVEDARWTYITL